MRTTALLFFSLLCISGCSHRSDRRGPDLEALLRDHKWFQLRNGIRGANAPILYRGAVEAAFNQPAQAEDDFRNFLGSAPSSKDKLQAQSLLLDLYLRQGRYKEALTQIEEKLRIQPNDEVTKRHQRPSLTPFPVPRSICHIQPKRYHYEIEGRHWQPFCAGVDKRNFSRLHVRYRKRHSAGQRIGS